jgi:mannose-6-phosphate isomerase-like protein (cupin superfamily)
MIIRHKDTNKKDKGVMKIAEYKINPDFSGGLIEINGDHGKTKSVREDRIYFIIEGSGKFVIDGKEDEISTEDLIFVPKNTPYNIIGKMKYLLICSPEYKSNNA